MDAFTLKNSLPSLENFSFPAEWEPHEAIWLGWPQNDFMKGHDLKALYARLIEVLSPVVKVKIVVRDKNEPNSIIEYLTGRRVSAQNVFFHLIPYQQIWFRDFGPVFVRGNNGERKIACFGFNLWGYEDRFSENSRLHADVPARAALAAGVGTIVSPVIGEGGNREFNGRGVMMVTEAVEFQRNPGLTRTEIEAEYQRVLGVTKIIWLKKGLIEDDLSLAGPIPAPDGNQGAYTCLGTGGHLDEFCRFAGPGTILLAEVTAREADLCPLARENRNRLEENFEILSQETDQDGRPFQILRLPVPDIHYFDARPGDWIYEQLKSLCYRDGSTFPNGPTIGVVPAASYLNFLITNDLVLAARYWKPGSPESILEKDKRAARLLGSVFPGRKIETLEVMPLNLGGGGLHCITQQEPSII